MPVNILISDTEEDFLIRVTSKPITLGRSSSCDVTLKDGNVSGKHLQIELTVDQRVLVKDLGSTNGTYLNSSQITESAIMLDDVIQLGSCRIVLDSSEMTPKEVQKFTRDFEKTNVTFVKLKGVSDTDTSRKPRRINATDTNSSSDKTKHTRTITKTAKSDELSALKKSASKVNMINPEEKSGNTQFIKLEKNEKSSKTSSGKIKKKKKSKKKEESGIFSKVLKIFKKD